MSRWFRWYAGTAEDGKMRFVARNASVTVATVIGVWAALLEEASNDEHRGVVTKNEDFFAAVLDLEDGQMEAILEAMQTMGMVDVGAGAITIVRWKERQFESDTKDPTNAERQRRYREKRKPNDAATERNGRVTVAKRPETDTEAETDTERGNTTVPPETVAARDESSDGRTAAYADLRKWFNGSTEAMLVVIEAAMGGQCRPNAEQWLASTVAAHGSGPVAQAFAVLLEKQAAGEISSRPLPHWSKIAAGINAGQRQAVAAPAPKRTLADVLRERAAAGAPQ